MKHAAVVSCVAAGLFVAAVAFATLLSDGTPACSRPAWLPSRQPAVSPQPAHLRDLYIHTVKHSVTGMLLQTPEYKNFAIKAHLVEGPYDHEKRLGGSSWPVYGLTMAGLKRMDNIEELWNRVLAEHVPGDFVETGVWRGGSSIFSRAILAAHGITDRKVHLVDSFMGLPKSTTKEDPVDWSHLDYVAVPYEEVVAAFMRYGLLDDQVLFHKGYFRYSMPAFRAQYTDPIAILRMDGDLYESTMDVLFNAYEHVPVGGMVIVDDYNAVPECKKAIHDFFDMHGGAEELVKIDDLAVWWQKTKSVPLQHQWYREFNTSRASET